MCKPGTCSVCPLAPITLHHFELPLSWVPSHNLGLHPWLAAPFLLLLIHSDGFTHWLVLLILEELLKVLELLEETRIRIHNGPVAHTQTNTNHQESFSTKKQHKGIKPRERAAENRLAWANLRASSSDKP